MRVGQYLLPATVVSGTIGAGMAATDRDPMTEVTDYAVKGALVGAALGTGAMMLSAKGRGWDYILGEGVTGSEKKVSQFTKKAEDSLTPQQRAVLNSFKGAK